MSSPARHRVFLLSPARCSGRRAAVLLNPAARFPLAQRLHAGEPVALGEAFQFVSGLYFRGKLAYAERFASAPPESPGVLAITATRGLLPVSTPIGPADLLEFAGADIHPELPAYRLPLARDAAGLVRDDTEVVLLGSIATGKYVDVLLDVVGERLLFPSEFVGRGDMSRGALLLRAARSGQELGYEPVAGAVRRGRRPPRGEATDGPDPPHHPRPDPD
ncbi:MAG TPA: hypothetical protein VFL95_02525 [Gemmatimonadales bacterium]|nr:hypothetical protein [Gemmatimonadales bacterium]